MVELLLDNSAEMDFASEEGCTPLIYAAESDQTELAKMLIKRGADVNVVGAPGTALNVAARSSNAEMATALRQAGGLTKNEIKYGRRSQRSI